MSDEIRLRIEVNTAGAKSDVKDFAGSTRKEFGLLKGSAGKFLGAAGVAGIVATATGAVVAGMNRSIRKGKEFQSQLADLEAITGITGRQLEQLSTRSLDLSVKYGESASNIIEANKLVASQLAEKIDFNTEEGLQELQEVSEQAVVLQKAAGVDLRTAVQATTTAINQFNLPASETDRLINSIAAGAKFGAAELSDQAQTYKEAGSVASSAGLQFETLNAATQVLAANAIRGSQAGTQLRNVVLTLQNPSKLAEAGIEGVNLQTEGLSATLERLNPLLEDSAALEKLFGRESITAAQLLIKNAQAVGEMEEKVTGTNTAQEQLNVQMQTFETAQARLSAALDQQLIPAFTETGGVLQSGLETLTRWVQATGNAVRVINELSDANSAARDRAELNRLSTEAFIIARQSLIRELEKEIEAGGLSEEQEKAAADAIAEARKQLDLKRESLEKERDRLQQLIPEQERLLKANEDATVLDGKRRAEFLRTRQALAENQIALSATEAALQAFSGTQKDSVAVTEEVNEETTRVTSSYKNNKERIEQLINAEGELTRAQWEELTALVAQNNALDEQREKRQQLAELLAAGGPSAPNPEPPDIILEDEIPEITFEYDPNPIKQATDDVSVLGEAWILSAESIGRAIAQQILYAETAKEAIKGVIKALLAETIALAIRSAFRNAGPFALALAPVLAAGATKLFSSLIPSFNTGGFVPGPNQNRDIVPALLTPGEFVVRRQSAQAAPRAMQAINSSPSAARSVERFATGGRAGSFVPFMPDFDRNVSRVSSNRDIVAAIEEQTKRLEQVERRVDFNLSDFNRRFNEFKLLQEEIGRS